MSRAPGRWSRAAVGCMRGTVVGSRTGRSSRRMASHAVGRVVVLVRRQRDGTVVEQNTPFSRTLESASARSRPRPQGRGEPCLDHAGRGRVGAGLRVDHEVQAGDGRVGTRWNPRRAPRERGIRVSDPKRTARWRPSGRSTSRRKQPKSSRRTRSRKRCGAAARGSRCVAVQVVATVCRSSSRG